MSVSVTLKSYFYEVLIPSSQKNTSSPIEDILHHVSISFMKKLALYKCFNPRTHTGCDGSSPRLPLRSKCFNPRTHTGCDLYQFFNLDIIFCFNPRTHTGCDLTIVSHSFSQNLFQSTHPHGVRRYGMSGTTPRYSFNPRTHTGCDLFHILNSPLGFLVSIHAPTRGATKNEN